MSIKKCCDNCIYFIDGIGEQNCCKNKNATISTPRVFIPKEDVVRKDERNKFITLLKSDLENFDGLADECVERKDIHELLENNAVRKYIESTIELLEKNKGGLL